MLNHFRGFFILPLYKRNTIVKDVLIFADYYQTKQLAVTVKDFCQKN
jgi:hypothetical protein